MTPSTPDREGTTEVNVVLTPTEIFALRDYLRSNERRLEALKALSRKLDAALRPHLPTADDIVGIWADDSTHPVLSEEHP